MIHHYAIQSDRHGNARVWSDNLQLPYTSKLEVICDQTTSNFLVYNPQLPHITSNFLMVAMVIMVAMVMVVMMVLVRVLMMIMVVVVVIVVMVVMVDMVVVVDIVVVVDMVVMVIMAATTGQDGTN